MIDKILGTGLLISFLIRDILGYSTFDQGILLCGTVLGAIYLIGHWWINKPKETSSRTVLITILYGLTFSSLTFTIVFKLLFLSGSNQMTILSLILVTTTMIIDFITSFNSERVLNNKIIGRVLVLFPIVGLLSFVNEETRVNFTYRKNPDFIEFYQVNKNTYPTFYDLKKDYEFRQNTKE
jgi:hypothetical protein